VSASVNLPLHHKVQKFSSGTGSPGWSRKRAVKQLWFQPSQPLHTNNININAHIAFHNVHSSPRCNLTRWQSVEHILLPCNTEIGSVVTGEQHVNWPRFSPRCTIYNFFSPNSLSFFTSNDYCTSIRYADPNPNLPKFKQLFNVP